MPKFDELKFQRVIDPNIFRLIPKTLFEQVKDYDFSVEKLMLFGQMIMQNPLVYLYALTDERNVIKGVLWARIDCIDEMLEVYLLSVMRAYQGGETIAIVKEFCRELIKKERPRLKRELNMNLKDKITWFTTRPEAFEKYGFKRAKRVFMECSNVNAD